MKSKTKVRKSVASSIAATTLLSGCTVSLPESFRFQQAEETFSSQLEINTKVDLLWVVDNSASMDVSQNALRQGFAQFSNKYMKPNWDIRVAVITTDTYMANPALQGYLNRTIAGTANKLSPYISGRAGTWTNPSWSPSLVNTTAGDPNYGRFSVNGIKFRELVPAWFALDGLGRGDSTVTFARLLPGLHDGPIMGLCTEDYPTRHFYNGKPQCWRRDQPSAPRGTAECLAATDDSALYKCVNTPQNDTVRSGKPIISTLPSSGVEGDAAWTQQLLDDFRINVTTGSAGQGSERGFSSILEVLSQNETSTTPLFRPGSVRGIIIVSDEDDQSMTLPQSGDADFVSYKPNRDYACDAAQLTSLNPSLDLTSSGKACCSDGSCTYGLRGTTCSAKSFPGEGAGGTTATRKTSVCADSSRLLNVQTDVKDRLDAFFRNLDSAASNADANYFVTAITPLTLASIQSMQTRRDAEDDLASSYRQYAVDRGDRYMELVDRVGNGSLKLEINSSDYTPILDQIGRALVEKKNKFLLSRAPTGAEDMIVKVIYSSGVQSVIPSSKYVISGRQITITDYELMLSLSGKDRISINYQPKTAE